MSDVKDLAYKDYLAGMKYKDIAEKHNVSINTIKSWKTRYEWKREKGCAQNEKGAHTKREKVATKKKETEAIAEEVSQVIENPDLTDKQRLFCIYYVRCFNATKAYQKAYECSYATAVTNGPALLRNTRIKEQIILLKQEKLNREFLTEADIFQKHIDIAFADMTDFVIFGNEEIAYTDDDGEEKTVTVSSANVKNDFEVDGTLISEISNGKSGIKVKLADRMKALQWLSDHMDLATEKQKAEIALLRTKAQTDEGEEIADDGFLEALDTSAGEDWLDEED